MEEINKVALIQSSLPPSWHTLITALEVRDEKELTLTLVESKLFDEELRRKQYPYDQEEKILKIGEYRRDFKKGRSGNGESSKPAKVFCYYCKTVQIFQSQLQQEQKSNEYD